MKNYRKIFEKHYNMKIPKGYDIHHIDFNRENNDIKNLLLLPRRLHHQYHFYANNIDILKVPKLIFNNFVSGEKSKIVYNITEYLKVLNECSKWSDYKLYMDDIIDNIHNIVL